MRFSPQIACCAAALLVLAAPLPAAERVILTNGFAITCNHHTDNDGHVRLYTSTDASSFIEFKPADIAAVETVPDPPPTATAPPPDAQPRPTAARLTSADLHQMLASAGQAHNLDVDLLVSVVKEESGGNVRALSRAGARGLMQLMPGTANELGVTDSYQPEQNIRGGSAYLDMLLARYHDNLALALAAYNAGPAAVDRYRGIPPYHQTRVYVARVIHEFNRRILERERAAARGQGSGTVGQNSTPASSSSTTN